MISNLMPFCLTRQGHAEHLLYRPKDGEERESGQRNHRLCSHCRVPWNIKGVGFVRGHFVATSYTEIHGYDRSFDQVSFVTANGLWLIDTFTSVWYRSDEGPHEDCQSMRERLDVSSITECRIVKCHLPLIMLDFDTFPGYSNAGFRTPIYVHLWPDDS